MCVFKYVTKNISTSFIAKIPAKSKFNEHLLNIDLVITPKLWVNNGKKICFNSFIYSAYYYIAWVLLQYRLQIHVIIHSSTVSVWHFRLPQIFANYSKAKLFGKNFLWIFVYSSSKKASDNLGKTNNLWINVTWIL